MRSLALLIVGLALTIHTQALMHHPPVITKQPPSDEMLFQVAQINENDKPFVIECEADSEPPAKYRWVKNGKKFEWQAYDNRISVQPGRGTLVVTHPREEDLGQYQCFAENEHGVATSNSVFVRKAELNIVRSDKPKPVRANEGEPFKLQCNPPDGWPKPRVFWIEQRSAGTIQNINNSRMTADPEGNLWFSNVTRDDTSDDFFYACAASNYFRNEYKIGDQYILEVIPSGISASQNRFQPQRQYVTRKNEVALRGKQVEMFCIIGGTPLPMIVWSKNGRPINWSERVTQGHYGKSIIIRHSTFEDAGSYTCEASNGVGNALSYSIHLDILATPYFTLEPEIQNAAEGETVEFRCEATGKPKPVIKWIHNGKPIEQAVPNDRRTVSPNSIVIKNLKKEDTGNYGCNATSALGYVYKDVYVNVLALPPEITEPPRQEATVDQRNVTLRCRVFGAPKPEVRWIRNQKQLTGGRYKTLENGDLHITDVRDADAGDYLCLANNKFGSANASGTLIVKQHTRITDEPQDYEVAAGTPATFRCNAIADSSLDLAIIWLRGGEEIDFEEQPRFIKSNDHSLTISKTTELDSGQYTCVAETDLDRVTASATLIVQDVPNAPELKGIECHARDATITWEPKGDNRSPILHYTIQYNTSFTPDSWQVAFEKVPATDFTYTVAMSPWANYTFRVVAYNKIGPSRPSFHSEPCTTQPDVPFKNPDNVKGKGTDPTNMVISWTPMPEIEHNAPHFHYRVSWRRDIPSEKWDFQDVHDWQQSNIVILDQQTFQRYRIKVVAINEEGEANIAPNEVIGYSGEDRPLLAPQNFTLLQDISGTDALLGWDPVPAESVRGHFSGYKVQTWTDVEGEEGYREIIVKNDSTVESGQVQALVTKFTPDAINYARVLAFNTGFNGPASTIVDFKTKEGVPSTVQAFEAFPLGSSAFFLQWKKPLKPNGKLTGYKIYYEEVEGTSVGKRQEREPHITDPEIVKAKLAGLKPDTKYRIHIAATTRAGEGENYYIEQKTIARAVARPSVPSFRWERMPSNNEYEKIRVHWLPNFEKGGNTGSHFFAKYRVEGEPNWLQTKERLEEDWLDIESLDRNKKYEFQVVAVDGDEFTASESQIVDTDSSEPEIVPQRSVVLAGWFIGMLLAIVFLLILFVIVCIIKRNRGGKYDVYDRELANGRRDYPEEGGFHEYSQPLDNKSAGRQSVASNLKESDTDSMAEYGEGDTAGMNEDGSFIGQYGRKGRTNDTSSTLV